MSRSKRILSFLMATVILMSSITVIAQGKASYVDSYLTSFDDLDKPVLTFDQTCTMVLDSVDVALAKGNMIIDLSILGQLRLNSVNNALTDLCSLRGNLLWTLTSWMLGDLSSLNVDAIKTYRRTTSQDISDTNVVYSFVQFLNDNKGIIGKLINGTLSLGIASSAFDPTTVNINQMVKKILYGMAYPKAVTPTTVTDNADTMVQSIITNVFVGELDPATGEYTGLAPELAPYIDFVNTTSSAYDFIGTLLQQTWNLIIVPLLNTDIKKIIREACGVVYNPLNPLDPGNASNLNEYAQVFNINYVVPTYTVPAGSTFIAELNNILAVVFNELTVSYTWATGANANLLSNVSAATKYVLTSTGGALFPDYLDVATAAEITAMNDQQLYSYVLRSLLNMSITNLNIPADADTLVEIAWYGAKEALASLVPQNNYSTQPKTQAGVLYMLADILVYNLNQTADMSSSTGTVPGTGLLPYGQGLDATLLSATNWLKTNYGSLFNATFSTTNAWAAINTFVFTILLQSNWLPASINGSSYELLINRLFSGILNLDVTGILSLFERRADSELATKTAKKILIDTFARIANSIFPAAVGDFTSFETLISNANLAVIIQNILTQLNTRKTSIMPVIIPLLATSMNKNTPQAYQDPDIQLPTVVNSTTGTFAIRNDSTGINTGATDKNGNFVKDNLYKISIVSVTSSIPAITLTNLAGTVINGGDAVNCALGGTFAADQQLMVTVTYNVLTEAGAVLTATPLSQRAFAYVSTVVDDGTVATTVNPDSNNYHKMSYFNTYMNWPAAPIEPVLPFNPTPEQTAKYNTDHAQWVLNLSTYNTSRNASMTSLASNVALIVRDPKTTLGGHATAATVSRGTATVNATLVANGITAAPFTNISTTGDGGSWNPKYYAVSATPTRPINGSYASNFVFTATKTAVFNSSESYTIPHKVVLYTDYDLPSILNGAIGANRDPNNYSNQTAYNNYITAIKNAIAVCYRPRQAATFMTTHDPYFQAAATALKSAIETLELSAIYAGVEPLKTAMDIITPPFENLEYDNPTYNYFGLEDYVPYTYQRYSAERDIASAVWASQQLPKEPAAPAAGATPAEIVAYNAAHAQWVIDYAAALKNLSPVKAVTVSYILHRFNLYAARLVRVQAVKDRLNEALTVIQANMPVESAYTPGSWATYERAYNFAVATNTQSITDLRQTKVNTARDILLENWKQLIFAADYTQLLAYISQSQALVQANYTPESWAVLATALTNALLVPLGTSSTEEHQAIIDAAAANLFAAIQSLVKAIPEILATQTGVTIDENTLYIFGVAVGSGAEGYIQPSTGGSLVFHYTAAGPGTGTTIELMDGETVLATYTVVIFGDINGNCTITPVDALLALQAASGKRIFNSLQEFAADINISGTLTPVDALMMLQCASGKLSISQIR